MSHRTPPSLAGATADVYIAAASCSIKAGSAPARAAVASEITSTTSGFAEGPSWSWWVYFVASFMAAYVTILAAAVQASVYVLHTSWFFTLTSLHAFGVGLGLCVYRAASRAKSPSAEHLCALFIWITHTTQRSVHSAKDWYAWLGLPPPAVKRFINAAYEGFHRSIWYVSREIGQNGSSYWRSVKTQTRILCTACTPLAARGSVLLARAASWLSSAGQRIWECFLAKAHIAKAAAHNVKLSQIQWQGSLTGYFCSTQFFNLFQCLAASSRCAGSSALSHCMEAVYISYLALLILQAEVERLCPGLAVLGPAIVTVALLIRSAPEAVMSLCWALTMALALNAVSSTWQASSFTACIGTASATAQTALGAWIPVSRLGISRAPMLCAEGAANSYQAMLSLHSWLERLRSMVGLLIVMIMAVVLTHDTQICPALLAMCVILGVTAALGTATGTWNLVTALLEAMTGSAAIVAAIAPPPAPASAAASAAAPGERVCHQHRHGVGANAGPRGAVPARAQLRTLPQTRMQAAHEHRLGPNLVRMPIAHPVSHVQHHACCTWHITKS